MYNIAFNSLRQQNNFKKSYFKIRPQNKVTHSTLSTVHFGQFLFEQTGQVADDLLHKKMHGRLAFKLMNFLFDRGYRRQQTFPSLLTLAKRFRCNVTYLSELLTYLERQGYIYKQHRWNNSNIYHLNPRFFDGDMLFALRKVFPILQAISLALLLTNRPPEYHTSILAKVRNGLSGYINKHIPSNYALDQDPNLTNLLGSYLSNNYLSKRDIGSTKKEESPPDMSTILANILKEGRSHQKERQSNSLISQQEVRPWYEDDTYIPKKDLKVVQEQGDTYGRWYVARSGRTNSQQTDLSTLSDTRNIHQSEDDTIWDDEAFDYT